MLREFEDRENLLFEMDEQVDAYREAGRQEAAARLEDQLLLIHQRFQELMMKFELFQRPPTAADYTPRLARVHRQLRDIRQKLHLSELSSSDPGGVETQLQHARCIYNALSDIKPEVENVIKMGRKIAAVDSSGGDLTPKIDNLKEDFNEIGAKVGGFLLNRGHHHTLKASLPDHRKQEGLGESSCAGQGVSNRSGKCPIVADNN